MLKQWKKPKKTVYVYFSDFHKMKQADEVEKNLCIKIEIKETSD